MTMICKHCGCENHLDSEKCVECGQLFNKDEVYVVCATCGISNPQSVKACRGCGEKLEGRSSFIIENIPDDAEKEKIVSHDKSSPEKKAKSTKRVKGSKQLNQYAILASLLLLSVVLVVLVVIILIGKQTYLSTDDGFYYVSETGVLHVVDHMGKDLEVGYDINSEPEVRMYGSKVYYLNDGSLNIFDGSNQLISSEVTSFKVNLTGEEVLYTRYTDEGVGDLYRYTEDSNARIDGNVGENRYIFGQSDDVYYVNQITDDENLGVLYLKSGDNPVEKIAEDVYEPLFSLRRNSVYYVRNDINDVNRFDVFYIKDDRVTEIRRNASQIYYSPDEEVFTLIQYKNDKEYLYSIDRDQSTLIQGDFVKSGSKVFEDHLPITRTESIQIVLRDDSNMNYLYDGTLKELFAFDDYYLTESGKVIYTLKDGELFTTDYSKDMNSISLDRDVKVLDISDSGESIVYESEGSVTIKGVNPLSIDKSLDGVWLTEDEKYVMYLEDTDAYVLKLGANEPVFLGSNVSTIFNQGVYVYTIVENEIYRYKLGKFSSNESITRFRYWDFLNN